MKQLSWLLNVIKPSNVRELINVIFLIISISFVVASFSILSGILSDVIRTIGASGTATTIIQLINQFTKRIEETIERDKFSTLFSCDNGSKETRTITFALPAFEIQASREQENNVEDQNWKRFAHRNLSMRPTKGAIANDVKAASYIISAYSEIFPRNDSRFLPRIRWDEDFEPESFSVNDVDTIKNTEPKDLFFIIGFSNSIFVWINNNMEIQNKYFSISYKESQEENKIVNCIRIGYFDESTRELMQPEKWNPQKVSTTLGTGTTNGDYDYGILAQINLKGKIILICAGISEVGTLQLAKYISSKWEDIYKYLNIRKENETLKSDEPFVVLFKIPVPESEEDVIIKEDVTILTACINKWN